MTVGARSYDTQCNELLSDICNVGAIKTDQQYSFQLSVGREFVEISSVETLNIVEGGIRVRMSTFDSFLISGDCFR